MKYRYRLEREAKKRAAEAVAASVKLEEVPDLERVVDSVLDKIAVNLCLSLQARETVLEYVRAAVGLSVAEAVLECLEQQIGDLFD